MMQTAFWPLCCSDASSLSLSLFFLVVTIFSILYFSCFSTISSIRSAAIQACEQQLVQFRGLSGSLLRWLQTAQDQLQSKEGSPTTEGLQRRVQQLKVCVCVRLYVCVYVFLYLLQNAILLLPK